MGANDDLGLFKRHRITAEQYHLMAQAGVLAPDARVELIEGEVIDMAPIGTRHWVTVNRLTRALIQAVGDRAIVAPQNSMRLNPYSEPEPDLALYKPRADEYATALPGPADTLLIIEVSDSSLRYDREIKAPLYARDGIAELWIVDLEAKVLRIYRNPLGGRYTDETATSRPGSVSIGALPGITLDLSGLFNMQSA